MKRVILMPDSFKGTMSSAEICDIMGDAINKYWKNVEVIKIPVADGGEGSVDAFLAAVGGEKVLTTVSDPYFNKMESFFGLIDNGNCAVIEMAACAGLPLVEGNKNPLKTTTYGVGELIIAALEKGVKKIIIGLGGSCTNDGGAGCMAALGVKFYNRAMAEFVPTGGTLSDIDRIDIKELNPKLKEIEIVTMCDIDNPLYGSHGAAYVFAPQKGADPEMVKLLDEQLRDYAVKVGVNAKFYDNKFEGAGAAGGMGFGLKAFLGCKMQMGIQTVLDTVKFDEIVKKTDLIFSGEGKLDFQSLAGKVVVGIARRAKESKTPLIAVVGDIGENIEDVYKMGVSAIYSTNRMAIPFSEAKKRCKIDLKLTMENICKSAVLFREIK